MCLEDRIIYLAFSEKNANILLTAAVLGALIYRYSSQFQNVLFCPISASGSTFISRNTQCIPLVKIIAVLDLEQAETF